MITKFRRKFAHAARSNALAYKDKGQWFESESLIPVGTCFFVETENFVSAYFSA